MAPAGTERRPRTARVDVAIPVYNEAQVLEDSVRGVHTYLTESLSQTFRIVIVDNASTDGTLPLARGLEAELDAVSVDHLAEKGRGRALRHAWEGSSADVVAYMDVDLSTGLEALPPLVAPLISGHSDIAIGTRLGRGSVVERSPRRELISRSYNRVLRAVLRARFTDAQCGFKALRTDAARELLPQVRDEGWFFDTELLILAERSGMRIHEVPVDWVEDPDSSVAILRTAIEDLSGTWRLRKQLTRRRLAGLGAPAQLLRFAAVGAFSTALYVGLYLGLRVEMAPQIANVLALAISAITIRPPTAASPSPGAAAGRWSATTLRASASSPSVWPPPPPCSQGSCLSRRTPRPWPRRSHSASRMRSRRSCGSSGCASGSSARSAGPPRSASSE